jgi:hypothetical protein
VNTLSLVSPFQACSSSMHTIHRRALHGALSCGSLTVSHSQLPPLNNHQYVGLSRGGLSGQQKQRLLSGVDPSSTKSCPGISTNAHRTAVSLHQRQNSSPEHGHHNQHSTHHHRQLRDDGSLKVGHKSVRGSSCCSTVSHVFWMGRVC